MKRLSHDYMETSLRHKWALFVARRSRAPWHTYVNLLAVVIFGVWTVAAPGDRWAIPFACFMAWMVITLLYFERRAFAELLAMRGAEIEKLRHEQGR